MRRRLIWLTFFVFSCFGFTGLHVSAAQNATEPPEQIKKEVLAVNESVGLAIRSGDTQALGKILSDTFVYTNQTGELLGKAQMLANIQSGKLTTVAQHYSDIRLHMYGDTIVMTGISTTSLVYQGKPSDGPRRFTRIYIKQNGQWRLVAQHVTLVAKN